MNNARSALLALALCVSTGLAVGQTMPASTSAPASAPAATRPARPAATEPARGLAVTQHVMQLDGQAVPYTVTAGMMPIADDKGTVKANIFYTAYTRRDLDAGKRPLTFAFNGGPGSASLWLHLGALGPKRAVVADDGRALPASFTLADNDQTWLDFTDLVFVDPVGTGYSRPAAGVDAKDFYSMSSDVRSLAQFIRLYVTQNERWLSPKFLAGESYGTTRAALLADTLQQDEGMDLRGLAMISAALDFGAIFTGGGNDLPYVLYVPSYAAIAAYHQKLAPKLQKDLDKTLAAARRWAQEEYAPALAKGDALPANQRKDIAAALSSYTGISEEIIEQHNLRLPSRVFAKELLRDQNRIVGIFDGRVQGLTESPASQFIDFDASFAVIKGPFTATMQDYLRRDLGYQSDVRYEFLSDQVNHSWDWGSGIGGFPNVLAPLRSAMTQNPNLKLFAAEGLYDLATGCFSQQYVYDHLNLPADARGNLRQTVYPAGHQIYTHLDSLRKLKQDVREFLYKAE